MPELITHTIFAYLIRRRKWTIHFIIIFLFGAMLPDLVSRPFIVIFENFQYFFATFHTPIALILICYLISLLFADEIMKKVFLLLLFGVLTHLFLDLFQINIKSQGYGWLFPFSNFDFQIGLFWAEDSILVLHWTIAIFLIDFLFEKRIIKLFSKNKE
jgi:hypothetical protein